MIQEESIRLKARNVWKIFSSQENLDLPEKLSGLSKAEVQSKYNSVVALQDVSFDVKDGETFVVMGLSGSGKSTLVRCINRLIEPTTGSIFVDDENILDYSEEDLIKFRRKKTSMVFQQFGLLPHRNVLENAAWGLEVQDVPFEEREERAMEVLGLVGLNGWEFYMPSALSGGMQQRVGLARAVASDPEILLMDEPFSALDPLIRRDMQQELIRLQEQMQKTTIFITHDMSEAVKLGTRIAIMREGAIIQTGTPDEIIGYPVDSYVAYLLSQGIEECAKKLGEESIETIIASLKTEDKTKMVHESADLLFHLLVLWKAQGIHPSLVMDELKNRENISGLEEKKNR